MSLSILMIDNLDSFTFNLVEACERVGAKVRVVRNSISAGEAMAMAEETGSRLVLSPGPGRPENAGCSMELISLAKGRVPLLGVCLGHQAIVLEAGEEVSRADEPVHGKTSLLSHDGEGPFRGLSGPIRVGRYHSLCTRRIPPRFRVHASLQGMAMAIADPEAKQTGLQFHPESVLTPTGDRILRNVLAA